MIAATSAARMTLAAALALGALAAPAIARADAGDGTGATADAGAATAAAADAGVYEHDVVEVKAGKKPIKIVAVDNQLGDVRVEGHDGKGLVIYAYKHAPDEASLDQMRVSLIPDPDGPVRISTAIDRGAERTTLAASAVRIDLVIRAPRGAKVEARVGSGTLELANMDAGGDLDAGAGAIHVDNVSGTVYARSVDGDQRFAEIFGDLDAQALDGDLDLDTVHGEALIASVHAGRIDGRRIKSRRVELRSTRGDIRLDGELPLGGHLVVASLQGNLEIKMKAHGALRVKARSAGTVAFEGISPEPADKDAQWVEARYGHGKKSAAVELRSRYGDVRFAIVE